MFHQQPKFPIELQFCSKYSKKNGFTYRYKVKDDGNKLLGKNNEK